LQLVLARVPVGNFGHSRRSFHGCEKNKKVLECLAKEEELRQQQSMMQANETSINTNLTEK